jgi:hypothetical protein
MGLMMTIVRIQQHGMAISGDGCPGNMGLLSRP